MIKRRWGLFVIGLLTVVVGLVLMFPARVAYQLASSPYLAMNGITGTVWNGRAREFSTNGIYLRKLQWHIRPAALLTGKAVYEVSGSPVSGFFESEIEFRLGGSVALRNLSAALPLQMFGRAAGMPGLRGSANVRLERLELVNGRAAALDGTVEVANLVAPMVSRSSIGGFRAEFFTQNNGIVGSIEDTDGVVDVAGTLTLSPDRSYSFLGYLSAKPETPENLRRQFQFLPQTDQPGQHELRFEATY